MKKMLWNPRIAAGTPEFVQELVSTVTMMKREDKPDYEKLMGILEYDKDENGNRTIKAFSDEELYDIKFNDMIEVDAQPDEQGIPTGFFNKKAANLR